MSLRLLPVALLFVFFADYTDARVFDGVEWQVESGRYDARLFWQIDDVTSVSFYKEAGLPLSFRLEAPYMLEEADRAALFVMSSPLKNAWKKTPVDDLSKKGSMKLTGNGRVEFHQNVPRLLSAMVQGDWGVIEVGQPSGVRDVLEVPAIDFSAQLQAFNQLRSAFPPIGWHQAEEVVVYFDLSRFDLDKQARQQLSELAQFITYDGDVQSIEIDGHTDSSGHRLSNLTLSQQRADAVRDYLVEQGVESSLVKAVRHHGQRYPVSGATPAEKRRVEIRLAR